MLDDDFNILIWWHEHKLTYPIMSILAKDVMFVPVSTVSSESCFSLTGRMIEFAGNSGYVDLHQGLGVGGCKGTS
jgi:hypothetical protein